MVHAAPGRPRFLAARGTRTPEGVVTRTAHSPLAELPLAPFALLLRAAAAPSRPRAR